MTDSDNGGDMRPVTQIKPTILNITVPRDLAEKRFWLVWRFEQNPNGGKPLKIPYWTNGIKRHGQQGSDEDRRNLATFDQAKNFAAKNGFDGIGFATLRGCGVTALDFDNCIRADGCLPEVEDIVAYTYAEYSPSGTGVRAFVLGELPTGKSHAGKGSGFAYGFETFGTSGFVTVTGDGLPTNALFGNDDLIAEPTPQLLDLIAKRIHAGPAATPIDDIQGLFNNAEPPLDGWPVDRVAEMLNHLDPDCGRDEWIRVGMGLHHQFSGDDEGFYLWDGWSTNGHKYPGEAEMHTQWDSFTRREGNGRSPVTLASVIRMAHKAGWEGSQSAEKPLSAAQLLAGVSSLFAEAPDGSRASLRFAIREPDEFSSLPDANWHVKGVIPIADLVMLYGASGAGKSFVALDLACSIALGLEWRGCKVQQAKVLLIVAEGAGGINARINAWCRDRGIPIEMLNGKLQLITDAPNILDKDDCTQLVASASTKGDFGLVIFDTLAQVTPGANENAAEDMSRAITNARAVARAVNATAMLVHHAGKDLSRGARGWSGLFAACDAVLEVAKQEDSPVRLITTTKQKDGRDDLRWGFLLKTLVLGVDRDGDDITSCVIEPIDPPAPENKDEPKPAKRIRRGRWENIILDAVVSVPMEVPSMTINQFVDHCLSMTVNPPEGERDTRRQHLSRALTNLAKSKADDVTFIIDRGMVILPS